LQPHHAFRERRLAASRLSNKTHDLASMKIEGNIVDGKNLVSARSVLDREASNPKQHTFICFPS
jgi:hypothetical protein